MDIFTTGSADYGRHIKALVCGEPGSGKTLISSTFPNPFFASAEGGLMSIWDRAVKGTKVTTSFKLKEVQVMAEQSADVREKVVGAPVDTIVIDTLDEIARILVKERLEETKKDTMAMGDWGWLGDQLRGIVRGFRNLDLHVVFTCHLKSTEDSETGRTYFKPAIQGAMGDEIAGYVDLALLLRAAPMVRIEDGESKRVTVRYLQTQPDLNHPWVKDRSGRLPEQLEINFKDDFERINALIFGGVTTSEAVAATKKIETDLTEVAIPEPVVEAVPEKESSPPEVETPVETNLVTRQQLATMTAKEKMRIETDAECEECGTVVDNPDQRDMAVVKYRLVLCNQCFKAAAKR